jgi:hypothetical protein
VNHSGDAGKVVSWEFQGSEVERTLELQRKRQERGVFWEEKIFELINRPFFFFGDDFFSGA